MTNSDVFYKAGYLVSAINNLIIIKCIAEYLYLGTSMYPEQVRDSLLDFRITPNP